MVAKLKLTVGSCLTWLTLACGGDAVSLPPPPPPLPDRPASPAAAPTEPAKAPEAPGPAEPSGVPEPGPEASAPDAPKKEPKRGASLYDLEPERKQGKPPETKTSEKAEAPAPKPAPTPIPPAPAPAPVKAFNMPGSAHVRIDAPAGLLSDLGKDSRMQPWLSQGVAAATKCYEREAKANPGLSGTIVVAIVMHENDRPDASLQTLPSQLSGMFACLTGSMMKTRMPLFTGKEGQRYTARVTFAP